MSKKSIISILIIGSLILLGLWAFIVSYQITSSMKSTYDNPNAINEKANIEELIITETREGQKFWEVYAKSGQYDDNQKGAKLTNIKGNFYKEGKVILSFDAPTAFYISQNKEVKLTGGSRIITDKDILITAQNISWTGTIDEIMANGNVKIRKANEFLITSDDSVFNTDFTKLKVTGNSETNVYKKN